MLASSHETMRPHPLLAVTAAVPSVLSRYLLGQWRINHGQHGAPAPGPLRLGAPKIENEKLFWCFC